MFDKPIHILRYGTNADQKYIEEMNRTVRYIHLNANMLAYSPASISEFLMVNCIGGDRFFFIDPITHAFQHSIDKIQSFSKKDNKFVIKKSIKKLLDFYGDPVKESINNNIVVTPDCFTDESTCVEFCKNILDFQQNTIRTFVDKKGLLDYFDTNDPTLNNINPTFLIAPYFYLEPNTYTDWLDINTKLIKICNTLTDKPIFAELILNKSVLENTFMRRDVIRKYIDSGVSTILLWIDDFDEHTVSYYSLNMYSKLVKDFYKAGIKVINLYGGYFSTLLTSFENELGFKLYGVGHGLEYGESRAVVPVGGGIPTSKYYYYPLHERLDYRLATQLLIAKGYIPEDKSPDAYFDNICNCPTCKNIIGNNIDNFNKFENTEFYTVKLRGSEQKRPYASQETKRLCILHFQYCKHREFVKLNSISLKEAILKLNATYEEYNSLHILGSDQIYHLKNWSSLLEDLGDQHE